LVADSAHCFAKAPERNKKKKEIVKERKVKEGRNMHETESEGRKCIKMKQTLK
jgi:hypothetical protein